MKKAILALMMISFCQLVQAQKIYVYGELNAGQMDSLTNYLSDVFNVYKKIKKIKVYYTSYQKNTIANCKPLVVSRKKFRNEINSHYFKAIQNKKIEFEFGRLNEIKNELRIIYDIAEIHVLDKCEAASARSSDRVFLHKTLEIKEKTRPAFINAFATKNAIILLSFYTPVVELIACKLDKKEIQFTNKLCNTISMNKDVELFGVLYSRYCNIKNLVVKQEGKLTPIAFNNSNFSHLLSLRKGSNDIQLIVTYANSLSTTHTLQIEYYGEEKINFVIPSDKGPIIEICQSDDRTGELQLQIQFETRITPNLLNLNIQKSNQISKSNAKIVSYPLSNFNIEDITSNQNDKVRKYCMFVDATDLFYQLVNQRGYGACLWPSDASYTIFFTMTDSGIRTSKELKGIIITDSGNEGNIKRPTCRSCN